MSNIYRVKWVKSKKPFLGFSITLNTYLFQLLQLLDIYCPFGLASLVGIPIVIASSGVGLKTCALSGGI